jgi:hypothetical protein
MSDLSVFIIFVPQKSRTPLPTFGKFQMIDCVSKSVIQPSFIAIRSFLVARHNVMWNSTRIPWQHFLPSVHCSTAGPPASRLSCFMPNTIRFFVRMCLYRVSALTEMFMRFIGLQALNISPYMTGHRLLRHRDRLLLYVNSETVKVTVHDKILRSTYWKLHKKTRNRMVFELSRDQKVAQNVHFRFAGACLTGKMPTMSKWLQLRSKWAWTTYSK